MHICDHHIKVYYNIEKRELVKIETEIYRGDRNAKANNYIAGYYQNICNL